MNNFAYNEDVTSIITEPCGRVLDYNCLSDFVFKDQIEKGVRIDEIIPLFLGYFPMTQPEIIIEDVSFQDFRGNILLNNNHQEVTILFYESARSSFEWAQTLQKFNQEKLIKNLVMKRKSTNLSHNTLFTLGFMAFEKSNNGFSLFGNVPNWFQNLFPNHNYSSSKFELEELFPFLEVFLPETEQLYNKDNKGKLISGLWAEYDGNNNETILQATAIHDDSGKFLFIESISERFPNQHKNIQHARETFLKHQQLIKTEKKLRQLFENQEQFISVFSHDIKGPLSGAFTLLQILKKDDEFMNNFNPKQAEIMNVMHKGLRDLYDYAYRLHDWSKVHFGNVDLDISEVNLANTVNNLKSLQQETLTDKGLNLIIDISPQLTVKVDEPFFKNAIHNLLSNAIKFSHENGEITISAKRTDSKTIVEVKDNGIGIPERFKSSLFEFSEKNSSRGTKGEKGSGIGLTVVKRIIDLHEGEIIVTSQEDEGTTVQIILENK